MNIYPPLFTNPIRYEIGDKVIVKKGFVDHVGVIVPGGVLHNSPGIGEHLSTLEAFANGQEIRVEKTGADPYQVSKRAREILQNPRAYDSGFRNCEHTVSDILSSKPESPQLVGAIVGLGIGAAIAWLIAGAVRNGKASA